MPSLTSAYIIVPYKTLRMQKLFNKILVPVDFSARSRQAIEKACDIAKQYQCSIHVLHVVPISPFAAIAMTEGPMAIPYSFIENKKGIEAELKKLVSKITMLTDNSVKADYHILQGTWDEAIIDYATSYNFDLVLVGQKENLLNKRKMFINPDKIAAKADIPVITVPSNRRLTRLFTILIPITEFLPVRKLMYGIYIASGYNTTLKLLGVENEKTREKVRYYLNKAYQLIKDNSGIRVELETVQSNNVAEAVNQFAKLKSADLVIVNPQTQTKMPGFFSSFFGNILQKYSSPPILTINPV